MAAGSPDTRDDPRQEDEEVQSGQDGEGEEPAAVLPDDGRHPGEEDDQGQDAASSHHYRNYQEVNGNHFQHVDPVEAHETGSSACKRKCQLSSDVLQIYI